MIVKSRQNEENLSIKKYLTWFLTNKTTCRWAIYNNKKVFVNMFLFVYQRASLFTILSLEIVNSLVWEKYFETAYETVVRLLVPEYM